MEYKRLTKIGDKQVIRDLFLNEEIRIESIKFVKECREFVIDPSSIINQYPKLIEELKIFDDPELINELKTFEEIYKKI